MSEYVYKQAEREDRSCKKTVDVVLGNRIEFASKFINIAIMADYFDTILSTKKATESFLQNYNYAIDFAQAIVDDETASQEEINAAMEELRDKMTPEPETKIDKPQVDKSALVKAITIANKNKRRIEAMVYQHRNMDLTY